MLKCEIYVDTMINSLFVEQILKGKPEKNPIKPVNLLQFQKPDKKLSEKNLLHLQNETDDISRNLIFTEVEKFPCSFLTKV